jgi:hypothetical protein
VAEACRRGVATETATLLELPFADGEFDAVLGNFAEGEGRLVLPRVALLGHAVKPAGGG